MRGAQVIRPMFSNPPRHGAAIVVTVLQDPELYALWRVRCSGALRCIGYMVYILYHIPCTLAALSYGACRACCRPAHVRAARPAVWPCAMARERARELVRGCALHGHWQ